MGIFLAIDLKSFYASVECIEKGYDPLDTNLVVADASRTEKTICLAVSPSLKKYGISGRARLFEVNQTINRENNKRLKESHYFNGESCLESKLQKNKHLKIAYEIATPRMSHYMKWSQEIYKIYLKYVSPEDIHVYSIDEVFMDVTEYLSLYGMTAKELGIRIMQDIFDTVGIRATCGIGTNLYLAKIALDITAKHAKDFIGELDEESYMRTLWHHRPLTDFWRVGHGLAGRLAQAGIYDMAQITEADEQILYDMIGIDAELLIDHAWGIEPVTIADIKKYKPRSSSITSGQVLARDYEHEEGRLIVKEMADGMCLQLVEQGMVTDSVTIYINYSKEYSAAAGVPQSVRGSIMLPSATSSSKKMLPFISKLYDEVKDKNIPVRKINLIFNRLTDEAYRQVGLFDDDTDGDRENKLQHAVLDLKKKYGRDAVLKGMNLEKGATAIERNHQIGGHRSGN